MGIQGLLPLLRSVTKRVHIEDFSGQSVAIDAYSWLHKGVYTCVADLYHQRPTTAFVEYCLGRIRMLRRFNIRPVMIFDGGPLPMKAYREEQRAQQRSDSKKKAESFISQGQSSADTDSMKFHSMARSHMSKSTDVTPEMAFMLIEALKKENVEFIVAPYEADAQMAYLDRIGYVSAIISEDSDLLLFGCRRILFKMDKFGNAEEICLDRFGSCEEIDLREFTLKKFRQMCILSGCDYLAPLGGIGLKTLHKYFLKHKTLDRVLYALRREANKLITREYEIELCKAELTFQHQRVYCPKEGILVHNTPLPSDIHASFDFEIDYVFEDLDFLGPPLDPSMARGIAEGLINPITFKPFILEIENVAISPQNIDEDASQNKLATMLKHESIMGAARMTLKRSMSSQAESIQESLRTKFANQDGDGIPRYSKPYRPVLSKQKGSDAKKQFSILNFCVPKSSLSNQEEHNK